MFLQVQTRIKEARSIIKEFINSLRRLSNNASVIVSFNYTLPSEYYQMLIPYFDKCIHITNDESDNGLILEVTHYKKKDNSETIDESKTTVVIPTELLDDFKHLAIDMKTTVTALIVESMRLYLKEIKK